MSDQAIFVIGVCVSLLCVAFVVASVIGLRESVLEYERLSASRRPPEEPDAR